MNCRPVYALNAERLICPNCLIAAWIWALFLLHLLRNLQFFGQLVINIKFFFNFVAHFCDVCMYVYSGPLTEKIEQKSGEPGMQSCFHELNQTVKRYRNNKKKKRILIPVNTSRRWWVCTNPSPSERRRFPTWTLIKIK